MSERHWGFVRESVADINHRLADYGARLHLLLAEVSEIFEQLAEFFDIRSVYSYEETGLQLSFDRDKQMCRWLKQAGIPWIESPCNGIQRGLKHRSTWAADWKSIMSQPLHEPALSQLSTVALPGHLLSKEVQCHQHCRNHEFQRGGISAAEEVLNSFLHLRARGYMRNISKPDTSRYHCSRLSPYLAWGNLSVKQVFQALNKAFERQPFRRDLAAFKSRLYWHCHFIQKFESECRIEFENFNRGFDNLRTQVNESYLAAWREGLTGYPLIDACMRCVRATGYLNFRMRAMVVSFLTHHLWQPWQAGVDYLAAQFLDFEPGIHYPQFQMQAGTVGTHIFRVYNPVLQAEKHDPEAVFIRKWIPELAHLPAPLAREPWLITPLEQGFYNFRPGQDYPFRIVDISQTGPLAQRILFEHARLPEVRRESGRILQKHSNPNRDAFARGEMDDED